jgi:thiol-disulfide isomerase/thioredoxin
VIRPRLTTHLTLALVISAAILAGCGDAAPEVLHVGDLSPHFELQTLDGKSLDSRTLAGHPVILSFWATWCQPCYAEIPALKALDADPRVEVVTIALDQEGATSVRPFAEKAEMTYTIALGNEEVFTRFSGFSIPFTLVLDAEGRVANLYRGPVTEEALVADVDELHGT